MVEEKLTTIPYFCHYATRFLPKTEFGCFGKIIVEYQLLKIEKNKF